SGESLIRTFSHEIQDPSTMAVIEYAGHNGLVKIEEFSLAAAVGRRTGSTFKEVLMSLYDSGSAQHSSTRRGTMRVHNAFMQVVSTTEPDAVQEFLRRNDDFSGYLNRWVIVQGRNRLGRYLSQQPPPPVMTVPQVALETVKSWVN